jgi:hypothetical protein
LAVVAAGQPDAQPVVHARRVYCGELLQSAVQDDDVLHLPVRPVALRTDRHRVSGPPGHQPAGIIVDADHRGLRMQRRGRVEQPSLGLEVGLHGGVEIQVITGQVGETAYRETDSVHSTEFESMTGHLHHHGVHATFHHHRKQCL